MKMSNEILDKIIKICQEISKNNGTVEDLLIRLSDLISTSISKEKSQLEILQEERKKIGRKNVKEYNKKTYEISKYNEVKFIYGADGRKLINSSSVFLNIMGYKRIPTTKKIFEYFNEFIVFFSVDDECDYCDYQSVIHFFSRASNYEYGDKELQDVLEKNNFSSIFVTQKKIMDELNLSSTKSLSARIVKYNNCNKRKIIPFKFFINGENNPPKILYLRSDLNPLLKFFEFL